MFKLISGLQNLGLELLAATPKLMPIYLMILTGLQALPIRNPHADLVKISILQQQISGLVTLELYMIYTMGLKFLRRRFLRA